MNKLNSFFTGLRALIDFLIAIGEQMNQTQLDAALTALEGDVAALQPDVTRVLADYAAAVANVAPDLTAEVGRVNALATSIAAIKAAVDAADVPPAPAA